MGTTLALVTAMLVAQPADAAPTPLAALASCRAEADDAKRLACYDAAAASLLAAEKRADVIVVDRAEADQTRRSLFGLNLPELGIFKRKGAPLPELQQVEGTLTGASENPSGQYLFMLSDGARWQQVDTTPVSRTPRPGDKIIVKRAALGSFKLSVGGSSAVRVRRLP